MALKLQTELLHKSGDTTSKKASKTYFFNKKVKSIQLDPMLETADIDTSNNYWGAMPEASKFSIFKAKQNQARGAANGVMNPMQAAKK